MHPEGRYLFHGCGVWGSATDGPEPGSWPIQSYQAPLRTQTSLALLVCESVRLHSAVRRGAA
eukprot:2010458-Alexandrium_andersonii.AAC.1